MKYDTYLPCDILKPYVRSFAISETIEAGTYKVLPVTGLVIGFQYKGNLSLLENSGQIQLNASGLTGLHDSYRIFKNSPDIGTVLVYFKEVGAAAFFRYPIHELFRESVSLEHFMRRSELSMLEEQLYEARTDLDRIKVVERFLISRMHESEQDKLVLAALHLIHESKGNIRIKELSEHLHLSQSPLEKRFRQIVGTSPKKFASIVRFQHTIQSYHSNSSLTELGYAAGFYDQAHFIKAFRQFTGESPETFFSPK